MNPERPLPESVDGRATTRETGAIRYARWSIRGAAWRRPNVMMTDTPQRIPSRTSCAPARGGEHGRDVHADQESRNSMWRFGSSRPGEISPPENTPPWLDWQVPAPVLNQQKPEQHAAQMREMCNPGDGPGDPREQLERAVTDHEILRTDRHGQQQENQPLIGKHHSEREEDSEHTTRSADRRVDLGVQDPVGSHRELNQTGTDDTEEIVDREQT